MKKHKVTITYCTGCKWLARAAWMAQEILSTFHEELEEVVLKPANGGIFNISVNKQEIWNRKEMRRFPEMPELKRFIRDIVNPGKDLGHCEIKN